MNIYSNSEPPPVDFVAFLAQRIGLTHEDAEHRLESWFGEYHASTSRRPMGSGSFRHGVERAR